MGNLGFYQEVTRLIKAVGGPAKVKALLAGGAAALFVAGGAAYAGYEKAAPKVKGWIAKLGQPDALVGMMYTVHTAAVDDQGLAFALDDTFAVVERDGDVVIIALTGKVDNPWAVSAELLERISDFPSDLDSTAPRA